MELLAPGPACRSAAPYRLVAVDGPEAPDFLQRLCSQDVLAMAPGQVRPAAFLDGKGKLVVTCLVARTDGRFLLEVQQRQHSRLLELLERYHFTEKLEFGDVFGAGGACAECISAAAGSDGEGPDGGGRAAVAQAGGVTTIEWARRGVQFVRHHADSAAALPALTGRDLSDDLAECLRMGAGIVATGLETEANTLALEADLDDHCSPTKGCYTGQEIVARIHTYGHTNRGLCLLHLPPGPTISQPVPLSEPEDDLQVGRVMHAVPVPGRGVRVGLGYLPKDFQPVGTRLRLPDGGEVTVAGFAAG